MPMGGRQQQNRSSENLKRRVQEQDPERGLQNGRQTRLRLYTAYPFFLESIFTDWEHP